MGRKKSRDEWKIWGNVFDNYTNRILFKLESQGFFSRLVSPYKIGKESNVFIAETNDDSFVMVKIYRLENCNFNKMYDYLIQDERFMNFKGNKRKIVFSWVQREYRNLLKARTAIRVPTPLAVKDHVLVMELIGSDGEPAPQLKDSIPENPELFFNKVIAAVKNLYKAGLVHGDLSSFNILNYDEEPVLIDFSQATTTKSPAHKELLRRDLTNISNFFEKLGVKSNVDDLFESIIKD